MENQSVRYLTLLYDGDFMVGARNKKEKIQLLNNEFHEPNNEEYDEWYDSGKELHSIN